jgi:hypothetical protein
MCKGAVGQARSPETPNAAPLSKEQKIEIAATDFFSRTLLGGDLKNLSEDAKVILYRWREPLNVRIIMLAMEGL